MQIIATRVSLSNGESSFYRNVKNFCSLRVICSTIRRNNEFFVERVSPVISEAVSNVCGPTSAPWKHSSWKGTTQAVRTQPWLWRNAYFPVRSWGLKCGTLSSLPSSLCYRLESGIHHFSIYFFLNMTSITLWKVAIIPARCHVPSFAFWNPDLVPKSMAEGKCPLAACAAFPWTKGRTQHRVTLLVTRKRPTMQGAELQLTYDMGMLKNIFSPLFFCFKVQLQLRGALQRRLTVQGEVAEHHCWQLTPAFPHALLHLTLCLLQWEASSSPCQQRMQTGVHPGSSAEACVVSDPAASMSPLVFHWQFCFQKSVSVDQDLSQCRPSLIPHKLTQ